MNTVVIAGAGTGKTYALVQRYLSTLLEDIPPSSILAVTFTEKAAAEMRSRVTSTLLKMARDNPKEQVRLRRMSRNLQSAPICTFHSFCAQLIRENAHFWNLDPAFDLLSPADENDLAFEIAQQVILEALGEEVMYVDDLVARFRIQSLAENLMSLNQQMIEHGLSPSEIKIPVVVGEMHELIDDIRKVLKEFQATRLTSKTTERLDVIEQAFSRFIAILNDDDDREVKLSSTFRELKAAMSGRFGSDECRSKLVDAVARLGSFLCYQITLPETLTLRELLTRFSRQLFEHKIRHDTLGFSDLLVLARQVLREDLHVRERARERFKRVLVDEFQDTSPLQADIVAFLCEGREVLFIVGDPKQSIYGFRGADIQLFNEVASRIDNVENLTLCRRSQGAIVELVNQVGAATLGAIAAPLQALKPARANAGAVWLVESPADIATHIKKLIDDEGALPSDFAILVRRIKAASPILLALRQLNIPARIFGGEGFFERPEISDIISALKLAIDRDDDIAALAVLRSPLVGMSDTDFVGLLEQVPDWKEGVSWKSLKSSEKLQKCDQVLDRIAKELGDISIAQAIDYLLEDLNYLEAMASETDADDRLANVNKLRAMTMSHDADAYTKIRKLWDDLDDPPRESLAEPFDVDSNAVLLMTIHQSKGLEFERVVLADTTSPLQNETDEIAFDPEVGIAITHRGRPIAVCAPEKTEDKRAFPTPIDMVRQKRRWRVEEELARVLYVAMTRAKEYLYIVDVKDASDRGLSLRRLLWKARDRNQTSFERLLPSVL